MQRPGSGGVSSGKWFRSKPKQSNLSYEMQEEKRSLNMSENRDVFVKKIKAKLDEWNAEIDKLEAQSRQKEADFQEDLQRRLEELKTKRQATQQKLEDLQNAGGSAWQDLKAGVEEAASALGQALDSARTHFQ
jgi:septation ring formation regulator EzrA